MTDFTLALSLSSGATETGTFAAQSIRDAMTEAQGAIYSLAVNEARLLTSDGELVGVWRPRRGWADSPKASSLP